MRIDPVVVAVQTARRLMEREPPTLEETSESLGLDVDEFIEDMTTGEVVPND